MADNPLTAPRCRPGPLIPCLVILVHLAYLVFVFAVQPGDRLGAPDSLAGEVYGDQDLAALALRGLNAHLGRSAGRPDAIVDSDPETYARALKEETALEPRYYLEYPHANLVFFRLPWWLFGPIDHAPPALLDGSLGNLTNHQPRDEPERDIWRQFRRATMVYRVVLFLLLVGTVLIFWRGYLPNGELSSSCWPLLLPCGLYYTINRFDVLPLFFTALALALLGRGRHFFSGVCLAAGALSKLFPGLLLLLVLRYLLGQPGGRRAALVWLAGFTLTVLAGVVPPLVQEGVESVLSPYRWQMNRAPFLWTAYGYILPPFFGGTEVSARAFRSGALLLILAALSWRPIPDLETLVRRGGVLVVAFVLLQNVFSPQWVLWFWPFLVPLLSRQPRVAALVVVLDLATIVLWPYGPPWDIARAGLQATRLAAMLGIVAVLLRGKLIASRVGSPIPGR